METMAALDQDGDRLRARLKAALTAGNRAQVTRHLTDNIWSTWLLSRVLEPFCQDYALDLARMGIDPELVRARAGCLQEADGRAGVAEGRFTPENLSSQPPSGHPSEAREGKVPVAPPARLAGGHPSRCRGDVVGSASDKK